MSAMSLWLVAGAVMLTRRQAGGWGSAGQEAEAAWQTETLAPPWPRGPRNCEVQTGLRDHGPHQGGPTPREVRNMRGMFGCPRGWRHDRHLVGRSQVC